MSQKRIKNGQRHRKCDCAGCQSASVDALQERLGAAYVTIDEFADTICAEVCRHHHEHRVAAAEKLLRECCRLHNLSAVEAGAEEVGAAPIFISRPHNDHWSMVQLYSLLPGNDWRTSAQNMEASHVN